MIPVKGTKLDGASGPASIELGNKLGNGAFGEVHRAVDLVSGRNLAIKFAQESFLGSGEETLAFKNDLLAAGKVKHPNVVDVVWVSESSAPPYLVMEFVEGGTLQAELRRRAPNRDHVPPEQVKLWFENVVDGMEAINAVLLHRDIKPDNILIDAGRLKITDFGLAKLVDAATRSQSFKAFGAIRYLAPESWRSEKSTIQRDMYAVGLTLFEIATLEYALPVSAAVAGNPDLWKDVHMFGRPKRLGDSRSDLPPGVEHVLLKLLEKRPEDRYATWRDVRTALNAAWTMSTGSTAGASAVNRIVRAVNDERAAKQQAVSHVEQAEQKMREVVRAAEYRWEELLDQVQAVLSELARLGTVSIERASGFLTVRADRKAIANARLTFLQPPHKFRDGAMANAVAVFTTACGLGFNVILRRNSEDDAYGWWQAIAWRRNYMFFAGRTVEEKAEPFALEGTELAQRIKIVDGMTSDLQTEHVGDVPETFIRLIAECLESRRRGRR